MQERYPVDALDRGLRVLNIFAAEPGPAGLRLTDISERLGMSKSLALRIATTLAAHGYLVRDRDTKRYRLGIQSFQLGVAVERNLDLRRSAAQILRQLADETRETSALVAVDATGPICIDGSKARKACGSSPRSDGACHGTPALRAR